MERELEASVFTRLMLNLDDLESAEVPDSVRSAMTLGRLQEVANTVSNLMFASFHEAVNRACVEHVLVVVNPGGMRIDEIKDKSTVNILTELKVDPENEYEVRIYRAARRIQDVHPFRGMVYRTSHESSSVWSTPDGTFSVRVSHVTWKVEEV
jgi:hypothetical protein